MMKRRILMVFASVALLLAGCNDDEDTNDTNPTVATHEVNIYSKDGINRDTDLASVSFNGGILQYCGSTDEQGSIDVIRSASFVKNESTTVYHYLFDGEGRVALAYHSIDGQNQSEVHKLDYGSLDSVYYSVHQFNWDNGVNFLEHQVAYGLWSGEYLGNVLYTKDNSAALELANANLNIFGRLSKQIITDLDQSEFTSIISDNADNLMDIVNWEDDIVVNENVSETQDLLDCVFYDNIPNPNGTPNNPIGEQDICFNTAFTVTDIQFSLLGDEWQGIAMVEGGTPPYFYSLDGAFFTTWPFFLANEPGEYFVIVRDSDGCFATGSGVREDFCSTSDLALQLSSTPGQASAEASGGTPPYSYRWFRDESLIADGNTTTFNYLNSGTYTCTVTDSLLCEVTETVFVESTCLGLTSIVDIDGNEYDVVEVGGNCWMSENLRTTRYNDGTELLFSESQLSWQNIQIGSYTVYDNDPSNVDPYGYLYNYHTVTTTSNVCPTGWHVPDKFEMDLIRFIGGPTSSSGTRLKSTDFWDTSGNNSGGDNSSGFNALPGGQRDGENWNTAFWALTTRAYFMIAETNFEGDPYVLELRANWNGSVIDDFGTSPNDGYSIRCIKDQ
ncbi:MAG: FISUMP domain-containing protein [Bacteroidota bacterium]